MGLKFKMVSIAQVCMPTQAKRRRVIHQHQHTKAKRDQAMRLRADEMYSLGLSKGKARATVYDLKKPDQRRLDRVEGMHGIKFMPVLKTLRNRFRSDPHICVLDEGAGRSTFLSELKEKADKEIGVNSIQCHATDVRVDLQENFPYVVAAPEELVKQFGPEKFHLIVSTMGGMYYSEVNPLRRLASLMRVLKSGGVAFVLTYPTPDVINAVKKLQKLYPNSQIRPYTKDGIFIEK